MILEDKVAVVNGAGGAIDGAVARAFAREGAMVFLTGRIARLCDRILSKAAGSTRTCSATVQRH